MNQHIEIKHLAPYLPHDAVFIHVTGKYPYSFHWDKIPLLLEKPDEYKLLLRPLSDLKKEITMANGTSIIPNVYLNKITGLKNANYRPFLTGFFWGTYACEGITYEIYTKFFEWHFDVFGLIDKGLAIDLNTLTNDHKDF